MSAGLIFEMLLLRKKLNTQLKATLFVRNCLCEQPQVINSLIHAHIPLFFIYNDIHVNFATFDNDDMKSSKRLAVFLSLIFLLKLLLLLLLLLCKCDALAPADVMPTLHQRNEP